MRGLGAVIANDFSYPDTDDERDNAEDRERV